MPWVRVPCGDAGHSAQATTRAVGARSASRSPVRGRGRVQGVCELVQALRQAEEGGRPHRVDGRRRNDPRRRQHPEAVGPVVDKDGAGLLSQVRRQPKPDRFPAPAVGSTPDQR